MRCDNVATFISSVFSLSEFKFSSRKVCGRPGNPALQEGVPEDPVVQLQLEARKLEVELGMEPSEFISH